MSKSFRTIALAALIIGSIGIGSRASATSGELYGVPSTCSGGYLCVYQYTNFRYTAYAVYGNTNWTSPILYNDASAFNDGTYSWDSRVDTTNGYYCLTFGRSWHDLSLVGPPGGGNYYKKGYKNSWIQFYC